MAARKSAAKQAAKTVAKKRVTRANPSDELTPALRGQVQIIVRDGGGNLQHNERFDVDDHAAVIALAKDLQETHASERQGSMAEQRRAAAGSMAANA